MNKTTRLTAIASTTMALALAGTAVVSAHPGDRNDRGQGRWDDEAGLGRGMTGLMGGMHGGMGRFGGMLDDVERQELTLQTADGTSTYRMEQGVVESAAADSLTFTLGSGESVTVALDEETGVIGFEEQELTMRGWSRTRQVPTEIDAAAIEAGAEVVVWSDAMDGASFVASRVIVEPTDQTADVDDTAAMDDDSTGGGTADASPVPDESVTETAPAADA